MEKRFKVMELAGRFDMELSDLDTKDMNELMNDMGLDDKERHKGARCSRSDTFRHCKGLYQGGVLQLFRPYGSRS